MSIELRVRMRRVWQALLALACVGALNAAQGATFDLCVRGTSLDETRTARLHLSVAGADLAAAAPQLGAHLANRRFWDGRAEEVFGAVFDPDVCGEAIAAPF